DRGTCHLVTDPNGEIVARFRYTPFGIPVGHPGCPKDAGCLDTPDKPRLSAGQRVFECNTPGVLRTTGVLHSDFLPIFSGHVWQLEIRMYRFGARWYDPYLGRFLTPDSYTGAPDDERLMHPLWPASGQVLSRSQMLGDWLKHPRSRNRYAYCANDPLNRADPNGHWAFGGVLVSLLTAIWTLPNTLFGLLLEVTCLIGEVVRWLVWLISLGRVTWESPWFNVAASSRLNTFALVFEGGWLGSFSNLLGVTFGNVFFVYKNWKTHPAVTALPEEVSPPAYGGQVSIPRDQVLYEHELRHTVHYGWFGPFFHLGLHYFGVYEWDVILGGFHNAWFERDARYHSEESFTDLPLVTPIVGPIPGDDPTKGSLAIQLIDENDQPVAHTTVLLVNKKEYCVTTNAEGAGVRYCIPPETYTLTYPPQVPATGGIVLELIDEQEQPVSTGAVVLAGIDGREWEASVTDGIARLEAIPPGNYTIFRQEATTGSVELELVDERGRQMSYASIVLSALDGTEQKVEVANGIARQDRISPETYTILLDSGKNEKGV
ncbi:RHS repeat-associated core domain-containing protein, partial [Candidatus Poribacteria bacterium]|nr:RHS repeat-associated core domain-containing protein [Candidatus Poribacteria bacterium]